MGYRILECGSKYQWYNGSMECQGEEVVSCPRRVTGREKKGLVARRRGES